MTRRFPPGLSFISVTALAIACSDSQSTDPGGGAGTTGLATGGTSATMTVNGGASTIVPTAQAGMGTTVGQAQAGNAAGGTMSAAAGNTGVLVMGGAPAAAAGNAATGGGATAMGGSGSGGASGVLPGAMASMGCGMAAGQDLESFVSHPVQVNGVDRSYFVRLPAGYDPARAYPLMIIGPGCGGSGDNAIPVQDEAGADAIVVGLNISSQVSGRDCFQTESPDSPELDYFDAMWAEVSAAYCVDTSRVFYGGFSSGSWLAYLYGCARANILRAHGNVAGGPAPVPECPGPIAAIIIHDENDGSNGIGGGMAARDRVLQQNGCMGTDTAPWDPEFPVCEVYTGCPEAYPVVWCQTSGVNHDPQNSLSAPAFWKFLMSLPPKPAM